MIQQKIGPAVVVVAAAAATILSVLMPLLVVSSYVPLSVVSGGGSGGGARRRHEQQPLQRRRYFCQGLSPTNSLQAVQRTCLYSSFDDGDSNDSVDSEEEDGDNDQQLSKILRVAVDASNKACDIIRQNSDGSKVASTKSTGRDLLTVVDPLCEQIIRDTIQETFPHHYILGEEGVEPGIEASRDALEDALKATADDSSNNDNYNDNDGWLWIVDPIDGTTNFASGIPLSMPIIAVAYKGEVVVGVLNDPYTDEVFTTIRGRGAFCNDKKISVVDDENNRNRQNSAGLADAVVGMESPAGQESLMASLRALPFLMPKVRTVRMLGSTAVFMPWVSMGRLQAYWTPDECVWDIAAGSLLVQEAGGVVTDAKGNPYTLRTRSLVASSCMNVHNSILEILKESNAYI